MQRIKRLHAVREALLGLPWDATVSLRSRDLFLLLFDALELLDAPADQYVDVERAADILGVGPARVRSLARRWLKLQEAGRLPRVRVRLGAQGEFRVHEEDCWRRRRAREEADRFARQTSLEALGKMREALLYVDPLNAKENPEETAQAGPGHREYGHPRLTEP